MHDKWREIKAAIGQGQTRPWSKTLVQVFYYFKKFQLNQF